MQKGRKGTYKEFEAHEAEVTLENDNDNDKEKEKQEKIKKRVGEGRGESAQNLHKMHKNKVIK